MFTFNNFAIYEMILLRCKTADLEFLYLENTLIFFYQIKLRKLQQSNGFDKILTFCYAKYNTSSKITHYTWYIQTSFATPCIYEAQNLHADLCDLHFENPERPYTLPPVVRIQELRTCVNFTQKMGDFHPSGYFEKSDLPS